MKLNSHTIKDISEAQIFLNITDNKMLLFALALNTGVGTIVKAIQEELSIKEEDIDKFITFYNEKELMTKKDLEIISKLEKTKIIVKVDFNNEIENILNDLNNICKTNKKITEARKLLITQWLRKGYTAEQFNYVHYYFHSKWGKDPQMAEYLKPETLYNTKFPVRVEDAETAYKSLKENNDSINRVFNSFYDTYNEVFNLDNKRSFFIPIEIQTAIAFWLKTSTEEELINVITYSIREWSVKPELIPYISMEKILDNKYPDRLRVANKKLNLLPNKSANESVDNWLEENE